MQHTDLQSFYPIDQLKVTSVTETPNKIIVKLKSKTHSCTCPTCGTVATYYRGTYIRRAQDLPVFGKRVELEITAYEYNCENHNCPVKSIAEYFDGFLSHYSRMTGRLEEFICTAALETSREGGVRICQAINVNSARRAKPICGGFWYSHEIPTGKYAHL